ncbi:MULTISPECIES: lysophospholipid acyltransferase family protein [Acidiphilium]|uniref:1-acyl-sn-glycerol-3-phosphate acyltransferase n=1 Tax=Acidiphilium iwatense TaxID=768198 RepID=A0ABS9DVN4_9PROT|nr:MULTISPECIES: lysophospholipid acyltransferase family protein [Acidiphilium]MCF3945835.1 1-acyl-sn-glycerol-3-phosphate acyltransferase [Acidiphilium iwatense]
MLARLAAVLAWTVLLLPVQFVLIRLKGAAKQRLPMIYWSGMARLLGVRLRVMGTLASGNGRPVLFVSNHSSWLDVIALGAVLPGCFVAKGDIANWPGINFVAKAGRTVFVSRARSGTAREQKDLASRLDAGDNLILFPEGTTSDGARVLPFRSSFLALAERNDAPIVQPVTIVYDQLDGLPICRRNRPLIAWYGDMDITSHYARLGRHNWRATIVLDPPVDARIGRKMLSATLEHAIASRAAAIRQGKN